MNQRQLVTFKSLKAGLHGYNFVACRMLMSSLGHQLFHVNQTYKLLAIIVYNMKNSVGF